MLLALLARLITGPHPIDDAYITFRYARNFAEGLGLVYNPGEWVLGTTAPLWAILLGGGYRLGFTDLPWLATVISGFCDAGTAALLVWFSLRIGWRPPGAALVGVAWTLNPMSIAFSTGGMETSLFVLVALSVLALLVAGVQPSCVAALAGMATLIRPEGALLALVVVGWTCFKRRSPGYAVQAALAAGAPMVAAGAVLWLRYGSPLPHSVAAKQVAYTPPWPLENTLALLIQAGLPGWSTYQLGVVPPAIGLLVAVAGVAVLIGLVRAGLPGLDRRGLTWQPFAGFAALYLVFYVVVGLRGVRLFPWYLVPVEPFYLLASAAGLRGAATGLARLARPTDGLLSKLTRSGKWHASWLAALLVVWQLPAVDWRQPLLPAGLALEREALMLDVGHGLAQSLEPTAVIAAPEIGALGYASSLRILDTVGLVSPAALPYYPLPGEQVVTDNAIPARLITDQRPEAVVTLDAFARGSLLPDPSFQRAYRLERSYPVSVWQSEALLVFRRIDGGEQ